MMMHQKIVRYLSLLLLLYSTTIAAGNTVPKLVYLIIEDDILIASNIEYDRFDKIRLDAKEEILESAAGNAAVVVVTNKRIMAYSVYKMGWVVKGVIANETLESVNAEDYSAMVITSKRYLSFNGKTGQWSENARQKVFE